MASRRLLAAGLVAVALLLCGCGGSDEDGPEAGPVAAGEVADLTSVDGFREAFADGNGSPRLLLLLSPT
jgi:hypothetical protein